MYIIVKMIKIIKLHLLPFLIISYHSYSNTIFDNVAWEFERKKGDINLFVSDKEYPSYYKAETILGASLYTKLVNALINYEVNI